MRARLRQVVVVVGLLTTVALMTRVQLNHMAVSVGKRSLPSKKIPGADLMCTEHFLDVPLRYNDDNGERVTIFVRELVKASRANASMPYLLYQQGGPGFPASRPTIQTSGWQKSALEKYRVLLLDQRGTGRSTPVTCKNLAERKDAADYLTNFRADSIVADSEVVRELICNGTKISLLGQSYGGFVILCYLSTYPASLDRCIFTCGLAPVGVHVDDVYTATFARMEARNGRFYERYPDDVELVRDIVRGLDKEPRSLPRGGTLTARRFLQLGLLLGSGSGLEALHDLLEHAKTSSGGIDLDAPTFLLSVERAQEAFETNPIYWLLHEPIYMCAKTTPSDQGGDGLLSTSSSITPSRWSTERVQASLSQWNYKARLAKGDDPILLTGEMVYSWMADDYAWLRPLKDVANVLANKQDWGPIYDADVLRDSNVPCAALMAFDDIYVERTFSERVAALLGPRTKTWVTNEFQHSGLRDAPSVVFDRLHDMAKGDLTF